MSCELYAPGPSSARSRRPAPRATVGIDVHIYFFNLDQCELDGALSEEEQRLWQRFATASLRHRYRQCRLGVRRILSRYLHTAPQRLRFCTGPYGKPALVGESLRFNLSHSQQWAGLAVAAFDVGFDCEATERTIDWQGLRASVSHPGEQIDSRQAFYRLWTRKEVVMKHTGQGFQLDPRSFAVPTAAQALSHWRRCELPAAGDVRVRDVAAPGSLVASLAADLPAAVSVFELTEETLR